MALSSARHSMSSSGSRIPAQACGSRVAMQLERCQVRGGRKGGLPIREETWMRARTGLSAALAGNEKAMPEKTVAVKLKHLSAQAATHAQSSAVFCVLSLGTLWWWSQSGIVSDADISVAVAILAAKPIAAGSV